MCITQSPIILYAYEAVLDANKLAPGDHIQLHAMGVQWADNACQCVGDGLEQTQDKQQVKRHLDTISPCVAI